MHGACMNIISERGFVLRVPSCDENLDVHGPHALAHGMPLLLAVAFDLRADLQRLSEAPTDDRSLSVNLFQGQVES